MKHFIWIIQDSIIRSDLKAFKHVQDMQFHLYISSVGQRFLSAEQRQLFTHIKVSDDHSFATVSNHIEGLALDGEVYIGTNDEASELLCVDLQNHFGTARFSRQQVQTFTHKIIMKDKLKETSLRVPRYRSFDRQQYRQDAKAYLTSLAEHIGFPMIAKPIDKYASMDVRRINSIHELMAWAMWSSSPKDQQNYELEEFIEGELYHCDTIVRNGEMLWSNVCHNLNPCMDYMAGKAIGAAVIPGDSAVAKDIKAFNAQALAELNPPDGLIHLECFRTADGELVFLEVAARPPGGDVVGMYQYAFGFDIELIHLFLRQGLDVPVNPIEPSKYAAWISFPTIKGEVAGINLPELSCESTLELNIEEGQQAANNSNNIVDAEAAVFRLYTEDYQNLADDYSVLKNHQLCEVRA